MRQISEELRAKEKAEQEKERQRSQVGST